MLRLNLLPFWETQRKQLSATTSILTANKSNNSSISNLDFRAAVQKARETLKDAADPVVRAVDAVTAVVAARKPAAVGAEEIVGAEISEVETEVSHSDEAAEVSMQPRRAATFLTRLRTPDWMPRHIP